MENTDVIGSEYERWEHQDSRASLLVLDGPDDDSDFFAPVERPSPDPVLYSLDTEKFTQAVGIQPTRTYHRGDRRRNGRYETRNVWKLRSSLPRDAAPHEHVKNILLQLSANWDVFKECARPYIVTVQVVSFGTNPGLCLDRSDMKRLAEIPASLDIDMYPGGPDLAEKS